jgi:hypothetical protein
VIASAEADAEQQAYYRRKVIGGASTMLMALGYAFYKLFWSSGFGSI